MNDNQTISKDYLILELRLNINKELYEEKIISYEIFSKMQNILIKKMNKSILSKKE